MNYAHKLLASHSTPLDAVLCFVCEKPLNGDSVRDYCHITGQYRGAAHSKCNLE